MQRIATIAALVLLALGGMPAPAGGAHRPATMTSQPEAGKRLHKAPVRVSMTFDTALEPSSELVVSDPCGRAVSGEIELAGQEMSVPVDSRSFGHYSVRYSADGAGDVGSTGGTYSFYVQAGPSCKKEHGGKHTGDGTQAGGKKRKLLKADDGSFLSDRMSPQMSLALVLLVPALTGLIGGFVLRRRPHS